MHWQIHKGGAAHFRDASRAGGEAKRMEVAVVVGADPASIYAASAPLPPGIDELLFSGFLRRKPVDVVQCKTVDVKVPADAEIVLEGYVDTDELRPEGPFGDHTGHYTPVEPYPVMHITAITHRRNPIYATTIVGKPPMEDAYLGKATERFFLQSAARRVTRDRRYEYAGRGRLPQRRDRLDPQALSRARRRR